MEDVHKIRRREILGKYPVIQELFGPEILTFPIVMMIIAVQFFIAFQMHNYHWINVLMFTYIFGGVNNHALQLAAHELSHNLCFRSPLYNKVLAITANIPTCVPSAITFGKYHRDHHSSLGKLCVDTDLPSEFEQRFFRGPILKMVWLFLQPVFYAIRPMVTYSVPLCFWTCMNFFIVLLFNVLIYEYMGLAAICYLLGGTLLGMGLHPVAGHFIAEHYLFGKDDTETFSYYGYLNYLNFNVGMHREHHDFPRIPWSKLGKLRVIAPEFYPSVNEHKSYIMVMLRFIFDASITLKSRKTR